MSHLANPIVLGSRPTSRGVINPLFQSIADAVLKDFRYIFSINSEGFPPIYRTHSVTVVLPADPAKVPEGVDINPDIHGFNEAAGICYSWTKVYGRIERCESGIEDKYTEVATTADLIAQDIVNWCNQDCPRTSLNAPPFAGVWSGDKPNPTEREITTAQKRLHTYYKALVAEADKFWETDEGKKNVSDAMRRAARELKLERVWLYEAIPQNSCPACGGAIPVGVAVCKHCNAVVNEAKARQFFPERFKAEPKTPEPPKQKSV